MFNDRHQDGPYATVYKCKSHFGSPKLSIFTRLLVTAQPIEVNKDIQIVVNYINTSPKLTVSLSLTISTPVFAGALVLYVKSKLSFFKF